MRDLKADLEAIREGATLFGDPNPGVNTQYELYEVAEHAIERAFELEEANKTLGDMALNMFDEVEVLEALCRDLAEALKTADQFITNGVEFGYIRLPDCDTQDPAIETPGIVRKALAKAKEVLVNESD